MRACFALRKTCTIEDEEPAMKVWTGAMALTSLLVLGGTLAIEPAAAAAKAAAETNGSARAAGVTSQQRTHHRYRHVRYSYRPYGPPQYLGRPTYYIPAPFPFGFDFGFGWW
jgi:hypothetical protein